MAPAAQSQGGNQDNSSGVMWTIAALLAILWGVWFAFKKSIIHWYLLLKLYELDLLDLVGIHLEETRDNAITAMASNAKNIDFGQLINVGNQVGDYLRYPVFALMIFFGFWVYLTNSVRIFKRTYNMVDLLKSEQINWPQVSPVSGLNLVKTDLDKGPWAMAMTPMQFCKKNQLLQEYVRANVEGLLSKERNRIEVSLKRGQANKIFAMQLGPLFVGADKLPPHTKALFAVFAARINNDTDAAANILKQLSISAAKGKLNFDGVDALLKKHIDTKLVKKMIEPHAYVLSVMAAALAAARMDGVQATADFLWLKPVDRRLWYMLNTVGRQTPFVEVSGPYAHWLAEKELGKKILVPMIEEATNALEGALKEIIYRRDEEDEK